MRKSRWFLCGLTAMAMCFSACGNEVAPAQTTPVESSVEESEQETVPEESAGTVTTTESEGTEEVLETDKILVAYFTRLPNTVSGDDLDAVVQGGGPYGAIGDSFETADLDAISSASVTVLEDDIKGNVQTIAEWIAEYTGADLFSIEVVDKYPLDYDTLIDQGGEEQRDDFRPELSTHIENLDEYSIIYLGYPNWYYDMPMALYSFLEEYDLSGKTIVPFATSAGSGFSDTISSIARIQSGATVIEDGLAIRMGNVRNSEETVWEWIDSLGLEP